MRFKVVVLALVALFATSALASAQSQTGEIFGKVTDTSGAVLPGVTVTVTGPVLLQPLTAVTSETGTFQFPRMAIGTYSVKFELAGFKTVVNQGIVVTVGFSAAVNAQLGISTVQETITVTGESPIVDTKATGTKQTFTNELLQSIPSARDPWVILQQTAGIAMDRENVGGNMSGQQSNYVSRGGNPTNNKWSLDGVDITDMSATGSSPTYYDFDMFEEMTVNTGGVDVTQQTGGVGINLVTKAGSDKFRGSSRYYRTNDRFESNNITDSLRAQGASSGNPIQDIQDYGVEIGGPLKKGRAWIWGAFGKNVIDVGVVGFYQPTTACAAVKAAPLTFTVDQVNACLNTDETLLQTTNLKAEVQLFKGNKFSLYNLFSKKVRNARGASDLTPIESTTPQLAVSSDYGQWGWRTGPTPTYKFGDQWVLSDRMLLDVQYAHVGNNFVLDYHDPSYATTSPAAGVPGLQPTLIVSTGLNGRSTPDGSQSVNIRPVNSVTVNANYFAPAIMGADHSIKFGGYWRDNDGYNSSHTPGNAVARFPTALTNDCAALAAANPTTFTSWCATNITRDGQTEYRLTNISLYGQDTVTMGKATLQLGLRYDRNHDQALSSSVTANPLRPDILPAVTFAGTDPGITFNNLSPRLGFTYGLDGGKTVLHANYAMYWGQVGVGGYAGQVNPVTRVSLRYPWNDANGDKFVQASEIVIPSGNIANTLAAPTGNWNPLAPGSPTTANTIDPNLKNDQTQEIIIGLDRELGSGFAFGANYIWRKYANFQATDILGLGPADFAVTTFTPAASACPGADGNRIEAASCPTVSYYVPTFQLPTTTNLTNYTSDQYNRAFNGVEITARKRMSHHWLMNTSYAYNSTIVNNGFAGTIANGVQEDPTNRTNRDGFQYDYLTAGSGLGNVFINAKWLYKLSGLYNAPFDINVSAFFNARQGYPEEFAIQGPSRPNGGGIPTILMNPVGETRLPSYANVDFHVDRPVKIGTVRFTPSMDVFNLMNNNTIQAVRVTQNATNANQIQAITAPRVLRFGVRVTF